jgi:hypothetical protein
VLEHFFLNKEYFLQMFEDLKNFQMSKEVDALIFEHNLNVVRVTKKEEGAIKVRIAEEIEIAKKKSVGPHRNNIWEMAWQEVLDQFIASNYDLLALNPKFIGKSEYLRLNGEYVKPVTEAFELKYYEILRAIIAENFLHLFENIYEMGSGSGFNLAYFSQKFHNKNCIGSDWVKPAVQILDLLHEKKRLNVSGRLLNLFEPNDETNFPPSTAVITFCAFEQLGNKFENILDYLLEKKPASVIQIEPIIEHYDSGIEFDENAIKYHRSRAYLEGYLTKLYELQEDGKIEIDYIKRLKFGSIFHECFSITVWRPI